MHNPYGDCDGDENDETFTVTLSAPDDATLGDATATGTIRDDDTTTVTPGPDPDPDPDPPAKTETPPQQQPAENPIAPAPPPGGR